MSKVSRELKEERDKLTFNVEEFTNWYYGGAKNVQKRRELEKYFLSDPKLDWSQDLCYLSYKERYEESVRRSTIAYKKRQKVVSELADQDEYLEFSKTFHQVINTIDKEGDPFFLHFSMFGFMMLNLTDDEQKAYWIPRILNVELLGTYAQTELGHGTYLKGLETTVTFDAKTKSFIINSPTLTSYKWWPGNMGHTSNYAVVMAQLYSNGKHYGVQPFIVQIRDEDTHKPLPGVSVGDIGLKMAYSVWNNGYLAFKNVKIPLNSLLGKCGKVLENGDFVKPKNLALSYGAMMYMRVAIVVDCALLLSKAVTIAIRYSLVRRQSPIHPDEPEPKILDHHTQQKKLFPALATAIIHKMVGEYLSSFLQDITKDITASTAERLPEIHALLCCLKAVCSNETTKAVDICRLACGGHGYLHSAGLETIYRCITGAQTGEGENTVMLLQTAKFLTKAFTSAKNGGKLTQGIAYLKDFLHLNGKRLLFDDSIQGVLRAVQMAAAGRIASAWKHIEEKKRYLTPEQATSETGVELVRASELHCHATLLQIGIAEIENTITNVSPSLQIVFKNILELYAVDTVLNLLGDILQFVDISNDDIEKLEIRMDNLLKYFRNAAIGIVDGFDFSDEILKSTLGAYDGNVYERLFAEAQKSPLNQEEVNKTFHLYLKPFFKSNL